MPAVGDAGALRSEKMEKTYLGDGLYAQDDGFQITLSTDRCGDEHFVCLDGPTLMAFIQFLQRSRSVNIKITKVESEET
jgi:hypothetical protein